jgi:hypothetical protein
VAGITFAPEPSQPLPEIAGDPTGWAASVHDPADVSTDPAAMGVSALLAVLLLLFMGFVGEMFNYTVKHQLRRDQRLVEEGLAESAGGRPVQVVEHRSMTTARLLLAVALVALISAFLNPDLSLSLEGLAIYLGFLLAIGIVLVSFELPGFIVHRRLVRETGRLRVLPWAIVIAAVFVLVSRLVQLQPGYLYGVVLGVIFLQSVSERDEGREAAAGAAGTLLLAVAAWWGLGWVRGLGFPDGDLVVIGLETALAAVVVAGLEAVAFGLMPFQFMPGWVIYRWRRPVWALLFGLSVFAFIHILIGPNTGYLSELSIPALMAALGVFAFFGAFSILFWAYFRFCPARVEKSAEG